MGATIDHITYCRKPKKPCTHTTKQARDKCLAKRDDLSCKVSREFVDANGCPQVDCSCVPKHPPQPTKESPACPKINIQRLTEECVSDAQRKCTAKQLLDEQGCPTVTDKKAPGADKGANSGHWCPKNRLNAAADECAAHNMAPIKRVNGEEATASDSCDLALVRSGKCYTLFRNVGKGATLTTFDGDKCVSVTYCKS